APASTHSSWAEPSTRHTSLRFTPLAANQRDVRETAMPTLRRIAFRSASSLAWRELSWVVSLDERRSLRGADRKCATACRDHEQQRAGVLPRGVEPQAESQHSQQERDRPEPATAHRAEYQTRDHVRPARAWKTSARRNSE